MHKIDARLDVKEKESTQQRAITPITTLLFIECSIFSTYDTAPLS